MSRAPALALAAATIFVLAFAAARASAPDRSSLEPAFHGTIVSTYPDGRTAHLWLNPDGSYRAEGRRRDTSSGHWSLRGDEICLRQSRPMAVPFSYCAAAPQNMRAAWSGKAVTGEKISIRLVSGGRKG